MDFISDADLLSKILGFALALVGAILGFLRWVRPKMRRAGSDIRAGRDALVGRDAVFDTITGKEIAPALPGIGVRMATTELQMSTLTEAVATLADNDGRLSSLEQWRNDVDRWRNLIDAGAVERVVTRAESAAAWRAVEAVANGTPPEDIDAEVDE
jgi:hypothetical protein